MSAKIYTKTGDDGTSKTISGTRKNKNDASFQVLGTIDELNASLGLIHVTKKKELFKVITGIQYDLFLMGSCFAGAKFLEKDSEWLEKRVFGMEKHIDSIEKENKPLRNFILPGGTKESASLHFSRTICRRLERILAGYSDNSIVRDLSTLRVYLNRLSDYLFVLARFYNSKGRKDLLWKKITPR